MIPAAAVILPRTEIVLILTAAALALVLIDLLRSRNRVFRRFFLGLFGKVMRGKEQDGAMTASTVLVASAALTILLFRTEIAVSAWSSSPWGIPPRLSWGGSSAGRHLFSGRTLEGSLSALLSCLLVSSTPHASFSGAGVEALSNGPSRRSSGCHTGGAL